MFLGALHGMLTAQLLALILATQFGPVRLVMIDADNSLYPKGSCAIIRIANSSHIDFSLFILHTGPRLSNSFPSPSL